MTRRNISLLLTFFIFTGIAAFMGYQYVSVSPDIPTELIAVLRPASKQLQNFKLTDQHNRTFTPEHLKNTNTLLFFGYTSCPDICPTTLTTLSQLYNNLTKNNSSENYNVVFVSVDPQRDTPERLSAYMEYFNPDFTAVTGSRTELDKFTRQFAAGYVIEGDISEGNYLVSHTSSIFLINSQQKFTASFSPPHYSEIIESQLRLIEEMKI